MSRALGAVLAVALSCVSLPGRADPARETTTDHAIVERSRKLFAEGITLYKKGDYAGAYSVWLLAYGTRPHYTVAANLGGAELKLNKYRDAAEHLAYALQNYPPGYPEEKQLAQKNLAQAKANIATVIVEAEDDAAILLDGEVIAHAPLTRELFIEPGERTFQARLGGVMSNSVTASFTPGSTSKIQLLAPDPEPAAAPRPVATAPAQLLPPSSPPSTVDRSNPARTYVLAVGGGLTLIASGIGTAYLVKRSSANAEADRIRGGLSSCVEEASRECAALRDSRTEASDARHVATVAFASAGAVAVLTLGAWLLLPSSHTQQLSFAAGPTDAGRGFTLQMKGAF